MLTNNTKLIKGTADQLQTASERLKASKQSSLDLILAKLTQYDTNKPVMNDLTIKIKPSQQKVEPKLVGEIKHYPPANKEWKNSVYAYNKNTIRSTAAWDKIANKAIQSYFALRNNSRLARSYRMRNLISRSLSNKRIFVSKAEIKQTSDKVNITVYILNREGQYLLRKLYFYNKNMNIHRDIYLQKLWLKKNLLAYKKTFQDKKTITTLTNKKNTTTKRLIVNNTYLHNNLVNRYFVNKTLDVKDVSTNSIKPFNNYFNLKKSLKLKYKLRKSTSVVSIRNKLSEYVLLKNSKSSDRSWKKVRSKKVSIPYSNLRSKKEISLFYYKFASELKYTRKLFLFRFIKYIYSLLKIKIYLTKSTQTNDNLASRLVYNFYNDQLETSTANPKNKNKILAVSFNNPSNFAYSHNKLKRLELLNLELINYLKLIISEKSGSSNLDSLPQIKMHKLIDKGSNIFDMKRFDSLFRKFKAKYYLNYLARHYKKEFLYVNYYTKFLMNRFKMGKFLPGLKGLIHKIYGKKVKLNIVSIKYPQLNSDIYAKLIVNKLKKRLSLLTVLKSSLYLAQLPSEYIKSDKLTAYNKLSELMIYKSLNVNQLSEKAEIFTSKQDTVDLLLKKIYPTTINVNKSVELAALTNKNNNNNNNNNKTNSSSLVQKSSTLDILNILKYKWVSGIRLEVAGRLTRRFAAARSVYKYRKKGNLRNLDHSLVIKREQIQKNPSAVMLRNSLKANVQYSFSKSKRRIGAFGLKAWIAAY